MFDLNNIFFSFPDSAIEYDCAQCKGTCCYIAGKQLAMTNTSHQKIIKAQPGLENFFSESGNANLLECGKKCWFLGTSGCTLLEKGIPKPLTCLLYPLSPELINGKYLVVHFVPCPEFKVYGDHGFHKEKSIVHKVVLKDIMKYVQLDEKLVVKKTISMGEKRFELEKQMQNQYLKDAIERYQELPNLENRLLLMYPQLRWSKFLLEKDFETSLKAIKTFKRVAREQIDANKFDVNLSNLFALISLQFMKEYILKGGD